MTFTPTSRILITGGSGSFGKAFIAELLRRFPMIERLVVYSRDELKQWELQQQYPEAEYPQLRFFLGDVRDRDRLRRALERVDTVVHVALSSLDVFATLENANWPCPRVMCVWKIPCLTHRHRQGAAD